MRSLPASALNDLLKTSKPAPGDGFAAAQHNYEILSNAVQTVQKARSEDPISYALTDKAYGIKPIADPSDTNGLTQELARRSAAAAKISTDYGTPVRMLTNSEAKALSAQLKAIPVEQQKTELAAIYKGIGNTDLFKQTMQSIAPDSPTTAVAGIYQGMGYRTDANRDVADLILRGQNILTPISSTDGSGNPGGKSIIKMPADKDFLNGWISETDGAFKGKEQASNLFMQTAKAIYAAKSAEEGDYSGGIDSKRWQSAISLATGGVASYNGAKIVLPYGMPIDTFQNTLKTKTEQLAKDYQPVAANAGDLMRAPLENVGDGKYMFRRGAGYIVDKNGRPLVVNMAQGAAQ